MKELGIGRMAELNCITKKALRVYQEAGLLSPGRIDEESGYRYYSLEQSSTIDMIQQLQALGLTLVDIKEIMDGDLSHLASVLETQRRSIDERMFELMIARQNVAQLLSNCRFSAGNQIYDAVILEHIPEKHLVFFDVFNENAREISQDVEKVLEEWELNLRLTKRHMVERGIPLALFHHVGCCVSRENLIDRKLEITKSFICIRDEVVANRYGAVTRPAGTYLTMYKRSYAESNSGVRRNAEREGILSLLDYAEKRGMSIVGDYYGVIIGETPAFNFEGREMLLKLEIAVSLDE